MIISKNLVQLSSKLSLSLSLSFFLSHTHITTLSPENLLSLCCILFMLASIILIPLQMGSPYLLFFALNLWNRQFLPPSPPPNCVFMFYACEDQNQIWTLDSVKFPFIIWPNVCVLSYLKCNEKNLRLFHCNCSLVVHRALVNVSFLYVSRP